MRRLGIVVCLIQFFLAGALLAQSNRATITGTVTDSTGAIAPNVTVTATNVDTGVSTATVTNDDGIYVIPNLPPGKYAVEFKKDGFETVKEPNIILESTQVAQLNSKLAVGATTQSVTVNAEAPVLDKETESIGTNMSGETVTDLPLSIYGGGRFVENFAVAITPGYSPISSPYEAVVNGRSGIHKRFYSGRYFRHRLDSGRFNGNRARIWKRWKNCRLRRAVWTSRARSRTVASSPLT